MKATLQVLQSSNTVNFLKKEIPSDVKLGLNGTAMLTAIAITSLALTILGIVVSAVISLPLLGMAFAPLAILAASSFSAGFALTTTIAGTPQFFKGCLENVMKDLKEEANKSLSQIGKDVKNLGKAIKEDVVNASKKEVETVKNNLKVIKNIIDDQIHAGKNYLSTFTGT